MQIEDNCEILFLDDWSLSGNNAAATLEHILYKKIYKDIYYTFLFNILTNQAIRTINRIAALYPYVSHQILRVKKIYEFDDILHKYKIPQEDINNFNRSVNPDTECGSYAILSDYKIPNQFGSYPTIYKSMYSIDRSFMKEIESEWISLSAEIR
jgi:hypothetical protein